MTKIAFIGAGSFGFTRKLVKDVLTFPLLENATIALMDIDPERLDYIKRACDRIVAEGGYPAQVMATTRTTHAAPLMGRTPSIFRILPATRRKKSSAAMIRGRTRSGNSKASTVILDPAVSRK